MKSSRISVTGCASRRLTARFHDEALSRGVHFDDGHGKLALAQRKDRLLADEFATPVCRLRGRRIPFTIRLPGRAIEYVISRQLDQADALAGACGREACYSVPIHAERSVRLSFGVIDGGPGRAVDDDRWLKLAQAAGTAASSVISSSSRP
jgi:hypothetical protein